MSLIFSNLVVFKTLSPNHRMYNLYAKFVKILEICKQLSENLVNDSGNLQYINFINDKPIGRIKYALN